jgi:hypothetical protein
LLPGKVSEAGYSVEGGSRLGTRMRAGERGEKWERGLREWSVQSDGVRMNLVGASDRPSSVDVDVNGRSLSLPRR